MDYKRTKQPFLGGGGGEGSGGWINIYKKQENH